MRRRDSGFTLLEMLISIGIMAIVLQTTVSSTLLMTRSGEFGLEGTRLLSHAQLVLERLKHELNTTATGVDGNGAPYVTVTGTEGNMTLAFRRIGAFGSTGTEIVPVFSTAIQFYRSQRQLIREQDGVKTVLMNDVDTFDCSIDALGRIDVQLGMSGSRGAMSGGKPRRLFYEIKASPQR
jgi:prepilin-type N-terminal cleavage/methylation domain-containing protein